MNHNTFFNEQLAAWPATFQRYEALSKVKTRELKDACSAVVLKAQFNPARIVSTGAKIDKASIAKRPCFLCKANRPAEQMTMPINGGAGSTPDFGLSLLVNPFPILPEHFTLPSINHQLQHIMSAPVAIHEVLNQCPDLLVFYNGPKCGASCPDHLHLQAGTSGIVPLQTYWQKLTKELLYSEEKDGKEGTVSLVTDYACPAIAIRSGSVDSYKRLFDIVYNALPMQADDTEPMMNILAWRDGETTLTVVIPRKKHRPDCYGDEGYIISPGALDMAGLIITPRQADFESITPQDATGILREVCLDGMEMQTVCKAIMEASSPLPSRNQEVSVGIVSGTEIRFSLNSPYMVSIDGAEANAISNNAADIVTLEDGRIRWGEALCNELVFTPSSEPEPSFTLHDVTIGVNFHWQRQEAQTFQGTLKFIILDGKITAINRLHIEDYLTSVISSEMSATSSLELLKAHAVISRSWLLRNMRSSAKSEASYNTSPSYNIPLEGGTRGVWGRSEASLIRWYDHDDHTAFDVCADDHCQRYQGITKATSPHVREAINQTRGQVLMSGNEICDARFSKCCGGITEEYRYCWENIRKPYLQSIADPFCNTNDAKVLRQVLNDYDQETHDFYEWEERIEPQRISQWLMEKINVDLGTITDLEPIERGPSGRLSQLRFVGTKGALIVGKELEIRRLLSDTHLYSSAFTVEKHADHFLLKGKGWGHGVGLCQIGAAVMGDKGYDYKQILMHYYKNARIVSL